MQKLATILFVLVSVTGAFAQGGGGKATMRDFTIISGCWERRDDAKKLIVSEQWMSPVGTSIIGMGRTVRNGKTVDWEFMRIEERSDGIYFVAKPKANPVETDFKLIRSANGEFVFENAAHDFPQRVIYRADRNRLTARIEGTNKGNSIAVDFPMTRVNCA